MSAKNKILLVEDDAFNFMHVQNFLEAMGFEVMMHPEKEFVDNYEDAISIIQMEPPYIAVLDIQLGDNPKEGLEIGRYILEHYYSPVIFLSGFNTEENLWKSGIMGANGFVVKIGKPIQMEQLKSDITRLKPLAEQAAEKRREGSFFYVKELKEDKALDTGFRKIKILWKDLSFVRTASIPNSVILYLADGRKYLYHKPLTECHTELPPHFLRFSGSEVINCHLLTSQGKGDWTYYINDDYYQVSPTYRTEETRAILKRFFP